MDDIRWIDLSHLIDGDTPVFPGDPPIEIEIMDSTSEPARAGERRLNCSRIAICVHNGTHLAGSRYGDPSPRLAALGSQHSPHAAPAFELGLVPALESERVFSKSSSPQWGNRSLVT